ncbi:aldehyde dehydrogenase family protein [Natranaerobius thermophilus]|uniref:aldehyde dehydrogenase family protein n=1 Tax=Natranaerobius thermophilus TaxID=375929 RepID=UPI000166591A|nr:aldehyde dehydrogenase family protein [Natranaerobius thermophilus]
MAKVGKKGYFKNYNPVSGDVIGEYKIAEEDEIQTAINLARQEWQSWKQVSLKERSRVLTKIRQQIVSDMSELVKIICQDTGKVRQDL